MKKKTLKLSKITIANLAEKQMEIARGGAPILTNNPKKCVTLIPLCIETLVDCNQSGTPCVP